jgi:hypothetical protein
MHIDELHKRIAHSALDLRLLFTELNPMSLAEVKGLLNKFAIQVGGRKPKMFPPGNEIPGTSRKTSKSAKHDFVTVEMMRLTF